MKRVVFITALLVSGLLSGCVSHSEHTHAEEPEYSKIIAARIFIQPEYVDEFIDLFQGLIELTLQEPGCTGYELFQDPLDPTRFLVFETYVDQAAVEAHFAAPYFAEYGEKIGTLAAQPAEIVVYDVAGDKPLIMKSMVLTGIRKMELRHVPDPQLKNPYDVRIKMKVAGVCGSDIHYYLNGRIGNQVVEFPFTLGHECSGEVMETGPDVTTLKPGDRVAVEPAMPCYACDQCRERRPHTCRNLRFLGCPGQAEGCLSEYIVMPQSSCIAVPDNMSYDQAAISEPLAIGVYTIRQSGQVRDKAIGILGFGPIGMSVMLAASARSAGRIYVTDRIDERLTLASLSGASWSGNPDRDDIVSTICGREPLGLDIVYECCGKQEAMDQAVELVKPGGKIMVVGIPEFDNWLFSAENLRRKEISMINIRRQNHALEETLSLLSEKAVDVSPMVTHRFPFSRVVEAFDMVAGYRNGVMKAMIDF